MKNQRGFAFAGALIILAVFTIIGGIGWYVYSNQDEKQSNNKDAFSNQKSLPEVLEQIKTDLPANHDTIQIKAIKKDESASSVFYKLSDYDFRVFTAAKDSLAYELKNPKTDELTSQETSIDIEKYTAADEADKDSLNLANNYVKEILKQNGFKEIDVFVPGSDDVKSIISFERSDTVCSLLSHEPVQLGCIDKTELKDEAEKVKPFVEAYPADAQEREKNNLAFSLVKIGEGKTKNDKYADVSIGPAGAYFYQKNGKWIHVATSSEGNGCDEQVLAKNPEARDALINVCRKPGEGL